MHVGFSVFVREELQLSRDQSLRCPSPLDQFPSSSSTSSRASMGRGAARGSLSRWVLRGAPAPSPCASKGQKKAKGNLLFHQKCRAESVNPSSCLRVVGVARSAHSRRLLLSFVTRKSMVQSRIFRTRFAESSSSKLCTL